MTFIDKNTFKEKYIDTNFDKILIDKNNHLINSYKYYIKYKTDYLSDSNNNLAEYISSLDELNHLNELERIVVSKTRIIYTYIDKERFANIKTKLTKLLSNQNTLYTNFMRYIELLNENKHKYDLSEDDTFIEKQEVQNKPKRAPSIISIESGKRPSSVKSMEISTRRPSSIKSFDLTQKRPKNIFAKIKKF